MAGAQETRELRCTCGALNDVDFPTCIRCNRPLTAETSVSGPDEAAHVEASAPATTEPERAQWRGRPTKQAAPDRAPPPARAGMLLAGIAAFVFALELLLSLKRSGNINVLSGGHAGDLLRVGALFTAREIVVSEPWRLVSAVFVHFGLVHFAVNMYGFVQLARAAETAVGPARTVTTFLVTGLAGNLVTLAVQAAVSGRPVLTAGASGGILGVMGLLLGVLLRRRNPLWVRYLVETLVFAVAIGFVMNASGGPIVVNNAAHVGGLVVGLLLGLLWGRAGRVESRVDRLVAFSLLGVAGVSLALSWTSDLPRVLH
ncbi:MAG: rhomboid family intramembrane serine protease [Polyangiaceae bacterium]